MDINDDVSSLKGVGLKTQEALNKCGIYKIIDLLLYFPFDYETASFYNSINDIDLGCKNVIVPCTLKRVMNDYRSQRGRIITTMIFDDGKTSFKCIWFNQPYVKKNFKIGIKYILNGTLEIYKEQKFLVSPKVIKENPECKNIITPKYRQCAGIRNSTFIKLINQILSGITIEENMPSYIADKYKFCSLDFAVRNVHSPSSENCLKEAVRRLKFQELLAYSLKINMIKKISSTKKGITFSICSELKDLKKVLPFELTEAQKKAVRDILSDEKSDKPMNRLLQGDVGSGKTIVSFIAMFNVVKNSYQAAMLVPTEILARQHFDEMKKLFRDFHIRIELLSGSVPEKKKNEIKQKLKEGSIDIIIGTHALFESDVEFYNLGLVVTDELHRFGVMQRSMLFNKNKNIDILVMTATPIPRTLTLYLYNDLDVSIINELPPGRKKIKTCYIDKASRGKAYKFAQNILKKGKQVYVVCPLVEENDNLDLTSVNTLYQNLKSTYFKNTNMAILHGKMNAKEKEDIMKQFAEGIIKVLIATTVIEVGINVPQAVLMIIEDSERFGLAELHQLRGRVGRGSDDSYCILIADVKNPAIKKRMDIIANSTDGFYIAEQDLILRGSGEMLGFRQHGDNGFIFSDAVSDIELFKKADIEAKSIIKSNNKEDIDFLKKILKKIEQDTKFICFN